MKTLGELEKMRNCKYDTWCAAATRADDTVAIANAIAVADTVAIADAIAVAVAVAAVRATADTDTVAARANADTARDAYKVAETTYEIAIMESKK